MTANLTDILDLTEFENELGKPCFVKQCPNPAKWLIWFKHGPYTCPEEYFFCQEHKESIVQLIADLIRRNAVTCRKCEPGGRMGGRLVSEYIRPLEL